MAIQIYGATDTGRERTNNEDSIAFEEAAGLCVLADGMGGHNAGEVASGMATAFIKTELGKWIAEKGKTASADEVKAAIENCVNLANNAILSLARTNLQYRGMGTTLVAGVFRDKDLVLGHIGDSRCYRLRNGQLQQLTKDHSLLQEQVDSGYLTATQALHSANSNVVTRALGIDGEVQTEVNMHDLMDGDIYLFCSDGLSDLVNKETIAGMLSLPMPLDAICSGLIEAANQAGGRDNISVILAKPGASSIKSKVLTSMGRVLRGIGRSGGDKPN